MLKLMKYEFKKTWVTKLIMLGITAVAEIAFLIGLYLDKEGTLGLSIFVLVMLAFGGVLVIGLESVLILHRDMNTKQSYMLFMTPNSCYSILGAKVLECGISIFITGAFYFALGALDITLLFSKQGELNKLWEMIQDFISRFSVNGHPLTLNLQSMAGFAFSLLTAWISTVAMAYLAVTVSAALLNGKRFNGLLSFVLFLALSWITNWIVQLPNGAIRDTGTLILVDGLISLAFAAVMYVVTAQIMEKKLSV